MQIWCCLEWPAYLTVLQWRQASIQKSRRKCLSQEFVQKTKRECLNHYHGVTLIVLFGLDREPRTTAIILWSLYHGRSVGHASQGSSVEESVFAGRDG